MVERPIKKSERLAKAASGESESSEAVREPRSEPRSKDRGRGKGGKKGGRKGKEEEPKQAVNPALMRGPRPVKPKPVVEEPPIEETATEAVEDSDETQAVEQAESVEEP